MKLSSLRRRVIGMLGVFLNQVDEASVRTSDTDGTETSISLNGFPSTVEADGCESTLLCRLRDVHSLHLEGRGSPLGYLGREWLARRADGTHQLLLGNGCGTRTPQVVVWG